MLIRTDKMRKLNDLITKYNRLGADFKVILVSHDVIMKKVSYVNGDEVMTGVAKHFEVEITGSFEPINGYTLIAAIQHETPYNIVNYGSAILYRETPPDCEHCHTNRRRKFTYMISNSEGHTIQVGKTCMVAYFGEATGKSLIARASAMGVLQDFEYDPDEQLKSTPILDMRDYLAKCCHLTKHNGFKPVSDNESTRGEAVYFNEVLTRADMDMADSAINWVKSSKLSSTYMLNLHVVVHKDYLQYRNSGLLASLPQAYLKAHIEVTGTITEGRQKITGEIVAFTSYPGFMEYDPPVIKVTLLANNGCRYYGTLPKQLVETAQVGQTLTLTGTVSAKDSTFGIFKRPSLLTP